MSRASALSVHRRFEIKSHNNGEEKGGVVIIEDQIRRKEKIPAAFEQKKCLGCGEMMTVGLGQIAYFHKACRKKARGHKGMVI